MGGICRPQTGWQRCSEILPSASLDGGLVNHLRAGAANARESRGCVRTPQHSRGFDKITASLQKTPRIVAKLPIQRCPNESCPQTPPKERQTFCKIWLYIKQSWCESVLMRQREKKKSRSQHTKGEKNNNKARTVKQWQGPGTTQTSCCWKLPGEVLLSATFSSGAGNKESSGAVGRIWSSSAEF